MDIKFRALSGVLIFVGFLVACSGEHTVPTPTASSVSTSRNTESLQPSSEIAQPEYEAVDPTYFFGRDGFPIFNIRTNSSVVNFCGMQQDLVFCGGVGPGNANQVDLTAGGARYYIGEGPLEPQLKYLEPGQRVSYGQAECAVRADKTVECSVGKTRILIDPSTRKITEF